jgi:glycosyltransferase involved in cell wall biosynthesis
LKLLEKLEKHDDNVRVLALSRNFGHQIAVTAGIDASVGSAVVVIDADLQDPPEVIIEMLDLWKKGIEVVYGVRIKRSGESRFKLVTAGIFYWLIAYLSDTKIPAGVGDFRLMDRKVVDAIKVMPERDRFIRGMVSWVGFKQAPVFYNRDRRYAGNSKYPLRKMIRFAIDGILSFSTKPLQIATMLGLFAAFLSLIGIGYSIVSRLYSDEWVPGWTLLFIAILFLGGIQMIFLGLIGEYIGRIYAEAKRRPLYLLRNRNRTR